MKGADVAAIILAAGRGTRFGPEPKVLARLDGKALVRHVVEAALEAGADPVLVVTGRYGVEIAAALSGLPVGLCHNPLYADGLSTSLRCGFAAMPEAAGGAVVLLGDMPRISASLIGVLIDAWRQAGEPAALVPTYRNSRSNPVVLSRRLAPDIMRLEGDVGAGSILRGRTDIVEWPTDDPAVAADIDTSEALAQARASTTPPSTAA